MDEILLHENRKVSTSKEAPEILDSDYDEKETYQVENMSLEETKEKLEWCKRELECEQKLIYGIENKNYMARIHDIEVNKTAEYNLPYNIINLPKSNKILNSH